MQLCEPHVRGGGGKVLGGRTKCEERLVFGNSKGNLPKVGAATQNVRPVPVPATVRNVR